MRRELIEATLDVAVVDTIPLRLIGDNAHDADALAQRLWDERGAKLNPPNLARRSKTRDGRELRRYSRRWHLEPLFAWLHDFR